MRHTLSSVDTWRISMKATNRKTSDIFITQLFNNNNSVFDVKIRGIIVSLSNCTMHKKHNILIANDKCTLIFHYIDKTITITITNGQ